MTETGREQDIQYVEQLEQAAAERDRLRVWLREISDLDPKNLYSGYDAVRLAKSALQEDNDEIHRTMVRE